MEFLRKSSLQAAVDDDAGEETKAERTVTKPATPKRTSTAKSK